MGDTLSIAEKLFHRFQYQCSQVPCLKILPVFFLLLNAHSERYWAVWRTVHKHCEQINHKKKRKEFQSIYKNELSEELGNTAIHSNGPYAAASVFY